MAGLARVSALLRGTIRWSEGWGSRSQAPSCHAERWRDRLGGSGVGAVAWMSEVTPYGGSFVTQGGEGTFVANARFAGALGARAAVGCVHDERSVQGRWSSSFPVLRGGGTPASCCSPLTGNPPFRSQGLSPLNRRSSGRSRGWRPRPSCRKPGPWHDAGHFRDS